MLIFILLLILIFPSAINKESLSVSNVIVVAMGIDKKDNDYEITTEIIIPKYDNSFYESIDVVSAKNKTIVEALDSIARHTGKEISLGHCGLIVINIDAMQENLLNLVDYMVREGAISYNCQIIATNESAKELLTLNKQLQQNYGFDINRICEFNNKNYYELAVSVNDLYSSYFDIGSSLLIPMINTISDAENGVDVSSTSSSSNSSQGSNSSQANSQNSSNEEQNGSKPSTVVSNNADAVMISKGKFVGIANNEKLAGLSFLNQENKSIELTIKNYTDKFYNNADINIAFKDKLQIFTPKFKDGKPVLVLNYYSHVVVQEILCDEINEKYYKSNTITINKELKEKIKETVTKTILDSFNYLKENNIDIHVYKTFNKWNYHKFNQWLNTLENKQDYLKYVDFEINFHINNVEIL